MRRHCAGEPAMCTPGTPFDDWSLGEDQRPWLALLEGKGLPSREPQEAPGGSPLQAPWRKLLEVGVRKKSRESWAAWLHLGTMRYAAGDFRGARQAWEKSLAIEPSAWALRNLAVLARHEDRQQESADIYLQAAHLAPEVLPLAIECFVELLLAGRPQEVLRIVAKAPPAVARRGRVRFLQARAALATGNWRATGRILKDLEVDDIREGDNAITDLWFRMHEQRLAEEDHVEIDDALRERVRRDFPPPHHLDYRMFRQKAPGAPTPKRARKG
jgi:tetratricopeptide (TPR) repeat protein